MTFCTAEGLLPSLVELNCDAVESVRYGAAAGEWQVSEADVEEILIARFYAKKVPYC